MPSGRFTNNDIVRLTYLLRATGRGDKAAFEELYRQTSAKLYGIALRILRRPELAEEALQDAYVKIFERAREFDPTCGSPVGWMSVIARNRALDIVRQKGEAPLDDDAELELLVSDAPDPAMEMELSDDLRRLARCLNGLENKRRRLVKLAYYGGLSRETLAAQFDLPVGTIKTWLRRSLIALRNCLDG